ncbi:MAG: hypothetical protein L0196_11365 [candidate division Zixibacteria bacterium]|nr:hypothetical protein [candidate division Zixibacteria bacterium]
MKMKKHWYLTILLIVGSIHSTAVSQPTKPDTSKAPATKVEAFLSKKGTLVIKDFYKLSEISGNYATSMNFSALNAYIPGQESEKTQGLKIEIEEEGTYRQTHSSFLDIEEIESLSKAISYMANLIDQWKGSTKDYSEIMFSTKDDFKIGFYQKESKFTAFASSGIIGQTSCFFSVEQLPSIKTIADQAISLLKTK